VLDMEYEWDPKKAGLNRRRHGVDFADAVLALEDGQALTISDPFSDEEERFISIGADPSGSVVVVVYTWRGDRIRLISARRATSRERRHYEGRYEERVRFQPGKARSGRPGSVREDEDYDPP
jgi:uncharacterized DUF497 family protein